MHNIASIPLLKWAFSVGKVFDPSNTKTEL